MNQASQVALAFGIALGVLLGYIVKTLEVAL